MRWPMNMFSCVRRWKVRLFIMTNGGKVLCVNGNIYSRLEDGMFMINLKDGIIMMKPGLWLYITMQGGELKIVWTWFASSLFFCLISLRMLEHTLWLIMVRDKAKLRVWRLKTISRNLLLRINKNLSVSPAYMSWNFHKIFRITSMLLRKVCGKNLITRN